MLLFLAPLNVRFRGQQQYNHFNIIIEDLRNPMTELLVKFFVKNKDDIENIRVRTSYGTLAGAVGICCNTLLFGVKLAAGMALHSVAVMADAFNNLSDAASSIIGLVGTRMAGKPADADHPFGHGRIEYISALIVAFLVLQVGLTFFKDSLDKIFHPEELTFSTVSLIILLVSVAVKLWMGYFNRKLGQRINSQVMLATAADSLGDVVTTSATICSILIFHFLGLNIDGFVGVIVACIVLWAGIGIARDTLKPLIGEPADPKLFQEITSLVESYEGIVGSHDLIIHNYGPGRSMASIHAEVPNNVDVETSHEIIDRAEREVSKKLNIFLVIHMDPVETENSHITALKAAVAKTAAQVDSRLSIHDFRFVDGREQINLIFDMVVPIEYSSSKTEELKNQVISAIKGLDKRFQCVITIDKSFIAENE